MAGSELTKKLEMPHLRPTNELAAEAVEAVEGAKPRVEDSRESSEYTFDFDWKDRKGKRWTGKFTSKILTLGEQGLVGILRARLSGNVPYESLDEFTREVNFLVAHLTYALKERADWAQDLRSLNDITLLQALYAEVAKHEAIFRGGSPTEG